MTSLVTGGAGFIGSHLVDELVARGEDVVVVDNFSHGKRENLTQAEASGRVTVVNDDVLSSDLVGLCTHYRPEVIYHLAAQIDIRASVEDPIRDAELNILSTIRLAEAARRTDVRTIVFTSSGGAIYGTPTEFPVSESTPANPLSPYAVSKLTGENYLRMYRQLYGLNCAFIAPSNVYGPRQDPHGEAGVVAIFTGNLLAGRPTKVFGEGTNTRDYVYVGDVVRAFVAAAGAEGAGQRFNIATGVETTDRQLHTLIAKEIGCADAPEYAPARLGDVARSVLDPSRARKVLGWTPEVDIRTGIARTVEDFRIHGGA